MPVLLSSIPLRGFGPVCLALCAIGFATSLSASEQPWQELLDQNRALRAQLEAQQHQLNDLRAQMNRLAATRESASSADAGDSAASTRAERQLIISGEVGIAFYSSSSRGRYPNQEFRVDDANLHLEAALGRKMYFFGEMQLAKHESFDEAFHLGEFYLELEDVSGSLGGPERLVNVRFGRVNIPFGEEYQHRNPLANPLVTHSLSDIWGTDEGIEVYGELGKASYAFAVQNGSSKTTHDYNADKALTLRVGFDVTPALHVSASGMRTGELASAREPVSEVWFGNAVFRNIGSAYSTTHEADLAEVDATYRWHNGHVWAAAGRARYRDNDPLADNTQHFEYFQFEAVQSFTREFYGALRFSTLRVDHGYPVPGIGALNTYFQTALRTKELQRITVGGGYRFNPSLVMKFDYSLETATLTTGDDRGSSLVSFETALGF